MNRILFSLIIIFAFAKCQLESQTTDNQNITPQKGLRIHQSTVLKNGEYKLLVTNDLHEKNEIKKLHPETSAIITIEGDSIEVDFNNLTLIGTEDLTKPDEFKGVAVHIKNGKNITIKNLNAIGYRIALQVDSVENLTIDSCNFSFNYRADSTVDFDINNIKEGAVTINASSNILIKNTIISNNNNGVVLRNSKKYGFNHNYIRFNPQVGIYFDNSKAGTLSNNQIDWNLKAGVWYNLQNDDAYHQNTLTHNGIIKGVINKFSRLNNFTATDTIFRNNQSTSSSGFPQLDPKYPKGEIYKIPTKYGVYNFEYPAIFLREKSDNQYVFAMFGPTVGNWKFVNAENVKSTNLKNGAFPATFVIQKENPNQPFSIDFEFIGAAFQDEFGIWNKKGKIYKFGYSK